MQRRQLRELTHAKPYTEAQKNDEPTSKTSKNE